MAIGPNTPLQILDDLSYVLSTDQTSISFISTVIGARFGLGRGIGGEEEMGVGSVLSDCVYGFEPSIR